MLASVLVSFLIILLFWIIQNSKKPRAALNDSENTFEDLISGKVQIWPSIHDPPTFKTSVIIPAYNESKRLPLMLKEALKYLQEKISRGDTFEIIIVDDGSKDDTSAVAKKLGHDFLINTNNSKNSKNCDVKVMTLKRNRGKGGAVTLGILASLGENILFVDADGASKFDNYSKLENALLDFGKNGGVAIGSRAHMQTSEAVVKVG